MIQTTRIKTCKLDFWTPLMTFPDARFSLVGTISMTVRRLLSYYFYISKTIVLLIQSLQSSLLQTGINPFILPPFIVALILCQGIILLPAKLAVSPQQILPSSMVWVAILVVQALLSQWSVLRKESAIASEWCRFHVILISRFQLPNIIW